MKKMALRQLATLLTPQEKKQGWRLPSRRHSTYKRVVSITSPSYLEGNRFAVLAKLLCSQRKELDRTGTDAYNEEAAVAEAEDREKKKKKQGLEVTLAHS